MGEKQKKHVSRLPLENIDVVILAGGIGSRLQSVLPDKQKVMAEVKGAPVLSRLVAQVISSGARRIILALGYKADQVASWVKVQDFPGVEIVISIEEEPMGTGGALRNALGELHSDVILVLNGDSFAAVDFSELVDFQVKSNALIVMIAILMDDVSRFGRLRIDQEGVVNSFVEKPDIEDDSEEGFINGGVYLMCRSVINDIPAGMKISLERQVLPRYCKAGLFASDQDVPFIDIGLPETLDQAATFFNRIEGYKEPR